jgi:hypothetical protein
MRDTWNRGSGARARPAARGLGAATCRQRPSVRMSGVGRAARMNPVMDGH